MPRTENAKLRRKMQRINLNAEPYERRRKRQAWLLLQLIMVWWLSTMPKVKAAEHWAYLPNPPFLHPHTWEDEMVPVYVNNTLVLGFPSSTHIRRIQHIYNFTGLSMPKPICFSKSTSPFCITVQRNYNEESDQQQPGIHWTVQYAYPKFNCSNVVDQGHVPQDIKLCGKIKHNPSKPEWRSCRGNQSVCDSICEWAPLQTNCARVDLVGGVWTGNNKIFQTALWKLVASMDYITLGRANQTTNHDGQYDSANVTVMACVPEPYAILIGNISINHNNESSVYETNCTNCILTNCIAKCNSTDIVLLVKQPSFVFLPVNLSIPWYSEQGTIILQKTFEELAREKRFIELLLTGVVALVTMIASTTAASLALTLNIKSANYVNDLAKNMSSAMQTQENWDIKIEQKLNALYDTVNLLGDELVQLETQIKMKCHYQFTHVCVTQALYNSTKFPWDKIKNHLQGIWHNYNTSLDLLLLHQDIKNIQDAPQLNTDILLQARSFVNTRKNAFPSIQNWLYSFTGMLSGLIALLFICALLFTCIKLGYNMYKNTAIHVKRLQLQPQELAHL